MKTEKSALLCGIFAVVFNIMMLTWDGVPFSIAFGIMGIAFAIVSKSEGRIPQKAKVGLGLSIIGLIAGIFLYVVISYAVSVLADPEGSKLFLEVFEQVKEQFPEEYQQYIQDFKGFW